MHYNTISHQEQDLKQSLKQSHSSQASTKATKKATTQATTKATTNQARSCRANNRTGGFIFTYLVLTSILGGLLLTCSSDPEPGETSPSTLSGELSYSLENQASQAEGIVISPLQEVEGIASMIIGIVEGTSITLYPQWSKAGQSISYSLEQEGEGLSIDKEKGILTIATVTAEQDNKVYTIKATGTGNYKGTYTLNIKLEVGAALIGSFEYKTTGTELKVIEQTKHTTEAPEWEGGSAPSGVAYTLSKPNDHVQVDASSGAISIGRGLHTVYTEGYTIAVQARATDVKGVASVNIVIDIESWCGVVGKDSGTVVPTAEGTEYTIEGWRELEWLARKAGTAATGASLASSYTMTEDIELPYQSCNERGETVAGYDPIGDSTTGFSGSFDGKNKTIRGLRIESGDDIGLFGVASGNIKDIKIEGAEIIGGKNVGTLVGKYNTGGTISNVHITEDEEGKGSVKSTAAADSNVYVGGLVGSMSSDTDPAVTESSSAVVVEALGSYVGGLVGGQDSSGQITKSYTTGGVTGKDYVAGIVGSAYGSNVYGYSSGDITGEKDVGGLVGYTEKSVYGYATGTIRGTVRVGGLVGNFGIGGGEAKGYSTGDVSASGDYAGGLAGRASGEKVNGFSTGTIQGNEYVGGLAGSVARGSLYGYAIGDVIGADSVGGLAGYALRNFTTGQGYFRGNVISTASDPSSAIDFGLTIGKNESSSTSINYYYSTNSGEGGLYQLKDDKRTAYSPTTDETAEGYRASTEPGKGASVANSDTEDAIKAKFTGFTATEGWSYAAGQWPAFIAIGNDNSQKLPDFGDIPNSAEAQNPYTAP